jgi:hypothetical protein
MTIDDAEHYTPEQREKIAASYPAHEREARTKSRLRFQRDGPRDLLNHGANNI